MLTWRPCSSCKKPIAHGQLYQVCSVSTCNRARTGLVFCCVGCWDAHVPVMNHRDAWCEEERAPAVTAATAGVQAELPDPARRRIVASPAAAPVEEEVLIVASRLKQYITDKADMNTSADVLDALSDIVRAHADGAIRRARAEGRKTVKGRDFQP
ncbi:MAG: hypothetical protein EXR69_04370 [Myxococcales bacterium]|nr:hypothetical protein [Myxococcales bacterium]